MRQVLTLTLLLLLSISARQTRAQDNLLQNGGFNQSAGYRASAQFPRSDFNFAPGWEGWQTNSPRTTVWQNENPIAFPHTGSTKREGEASQNIGRGDATFTAAAYQVIDGIDEGTTLRASAFVFQENESNVGARTRIGIGSNTGGNPLGSVTWSPWMRATDSWQEISVEATVPAGSVTVFIYSTQDLPNERNQVYYDSASLVITGAGEPNVGEEGGGDGEANVPPPPTSPPFAAFVSPQQADESGRIEHTVVPGDTLAAISVAYGVPADEILALNGLESGRFLSVGQVLLISEGSPESATEPTAEPADTTDDAESAEDDAAPTTPPLEPDSVDVVGFASPTPQDVASVATGVPTDVPAEPTPLPVQPVGPVVDPQDAPPAPVATSNNAASDPLAVETQICVLMFDDANQNRLRDASETLLADGVLTLNTPDDGEEVYITDGSSEPFCFEGLGAGRHILGAVAPEGYGLTTSASLVVNTQPGQTFDLRFGAAQGVEAAVVPTADGSAVSDNELEIIAEADSANTDLRSVAGLLVLGAAGVVLLGGIIIGLIARRLG